MLSFTLRIEEELRDKIAEIANKEQRSINAQIIYILQKYIENEKKDTN